MSMIYEEIILEEIPKIIHGIINDTCSSDDMIGNTIEKYTYGRKRPMISLRDTEEQIEIKIE